jgi:hypothetical protein
MSHLRRFMFGVAFACALAAITALIAWLGCSIGNAIMLVLCGLAGVFGIYVIGSLIEYELVYRSHLGRPK